MPCRSQSQPGSTSDGRCERAAGGRGKAGKNGIRISSAFGWFCCPSRFSKDGFGWTGSRFEEPGKRSDAEISTLLADGIQGIECAEGVYPIREGLRVQRVYLMDDSKWRALVAAASEALKNPNFRAAMGKETAAFKDSDYIEETRVAHLEDSCNAVSTRWGFTIKKGMSGTRFKDRLIARAYEDAEKENISSDSPVPSAAAQRFVFETCTERQWIPHAWDFSTDFLQGKCIERKYAIVIARPDGYAAPGIA
jgi:hypothetical protein